MDLWNPMSPGTNKRHEPSSLGTWEYREDERTSPAEPGCRVASRAGGDASQPGCGPPG